MDFQKYYNEYVGLSPLKKEELIDELFKELFQEGEIEIWYEETYYGTDEGQVALMYRKLTTPQKFEETKNKTREISEQREDEIFEELSPMVYVTTYGLCNDRQFRVLQNLSSKGGLRC